VLVKITWNKITQKSEWPISSEELDGPAVSALRRAIAEVKQRWLVIGWVPNVRLYNI
jgi:hypothetical protein